MNYSLPSMMVALENGHLPTTWQESELMFWNNGLLYHDVIIRDQPIVFLRTNIDTDISAIHGPIADMDISKIFISCSLLHNKKHNVFYALPFFKSFKNKDLW